MWKVSSNIWKLNVIAACTDMMFFIPILIPFLETFGLSMQQILMVEGVFSATMVILEVPSGYFADVFGRKLSIVIGSVFFLFSMIGFTLADNFWQFAFAEVVGGIGLSFRSGAIEALLYDSLIDLKKENEYKKYQGNVFLSMRGASVFAYLLGGFLAAYFLKLPVYLAVLPALVSVPFAFLLKEPGKHGHVVEKWEHFVQIVKESFVHYPKLRWFLFYAAVPWGFSFATFWLFQAYMEGVEIPVFWFGIILSLMNLAGGLAAKYAYKLEDWFTLKGALGSVPILFLIAWVPLAVFKAKWAVIFMPISSMGWGISVVFFKDFVQKLVTSDRRATIMSIMSLLERCVFFTYAPIVGWFADFWSVQMALGMSALIMATLTAVLWVVMMRLKVV